MKRIYYILLLGIAFATKAGAQNYDELLRTVISNNPEIAALAAANESEVQSLKSENTLPAPEVEFEHQWGQHNIGNKWAVSISQSFEWPGVYDARSKAIKSTSEAMRFLDRSNYLDKMLEAKLLFIDIVNVRKEIALISEVREHMTKLQEKYRESYRHGEVSILDVNKIDIEHIAISRKYNDLLNSLEVLKSSLTALNGGKDCSEILSSLNEYPDDKLLSEEAYTGLIRENDPYLSYNSLMTQAQALNVKAAKYSRLPELSLGYIHNYELGERFNGIKVGITLPFFSKRSKIKAAESLQESYDMQATALQVNRLTAMYSDRANVIALGKEVDCYRPIFEDSNNLELLKKALDGGEISLLNYLQETNYFLSARQDYMNAVYQYHYALARLNRYTLLQ